MSRCNSQHLSSGSGQSLIELVVVIGIVVTTLTALIAATTASLRTTSSDQTRSVAVKYAQEGIDIVRRERDRGWDGLITKASENNGQYCLGVDGAFTPAPCTTPNLVEGSLIRSVVLSSVPVPTPPAIAPYISVTVSVSWADSARTNPVSITTRLTQWK